MANDRILIKCRHCGEKRTLAKYYPSNYGVWGNQVPEIVKFIDTHMACSPNIGSMSLNGDRCFDLETELDHE